MSRAEGARRAIIRLDELQPVNTLLTDEANLAIAANGILSAATVDWHALNSTLFPSTADGSDPLDSVNLSDPAFLAEWPKIRRGQIETVKDLIRNSKRNDTFLTIDTPVISFNVPNPSRWAYSHASVLEILAQEIGFPFTPTGYVPVRSDPSAFLADQRMRYLSAVLAYDALTVITTNIARVFTDASLSSSMIAALMTNLQTFAEADRTELVRNARLTWNHYHVPQEAQDEATRLAATRQRLTQSLTERIELHRLKQDTTDGLSVFRAHGILGRRAKASNASRTWGIELEITDAGRIMYDQAGGWSRLRDQSLRPQIGDGKVYDPWEFTSPILTSTYSAGLWMICDQAKNTVKYWRAGVHVHVSARPRFRKDRKWVEGDPLSTAQVSRLLEIYAVSSKYLDVIIQRGKSREFCVPIKIDQWVNGWLPLQRGKKLHARNPNVHQHPDAIANAKKWAQITHGPNHDNEPTEWKRHQEVNLQALNKYGTIEFRAMGAVYDYEQLTTWAWLCREMVNYAQSDSSLAPLYSAHTMDEFLDFWERVAVEKLSRKKVNHVRFDRVQSVPA